ncbi:OmpA family protein [Fredinandcohnia sp. 179-A 10B2 NHS]|uniref:OmpA family protein n=1 Tax=Fredinandcohnia sp. 179-A 10B2 NHS TaxID=3235176 RepID=UPI0039A04CAA
MRKNFRTKYEQDHQAGDFWMSYSDLMAGLLLVFILLLSVSIFDYRNDLKEKEASIDEYQEQLEVKEQKIQEILGVKAEIIKALTQEFQDSNLTMQIDPQTGAISFQGGVFFDTNSDEVSDSGYNMLNQFAPKYIEILLAGPYKEYVAQIIVEGHTDNNGSYIYNLDLSQRRALSVVKAMFSEKVLLNNKAELQNFITANGRSFSQPVYDGDNYNPDKSRRVEFKFRLKDDEMIQELMKLVKVE